MLFKVSHRLQKVILNLSFYEEILSSSDKCPGFVTLMSSVDAIFHKLAQPVATAATLPQEDADWSGHIGLEIFAIQQINCLSSKGKTALSLRNIFHKVYSLAWHTLSCIYCLFQKQKSASF